jgi:hypothetical protein
MYVILLGEQTGVQAKAFEKRTPPGAQSVDVGRMNIAAAVCAGSPGAMIVGHEHDDVCVT